MTGAEGFVAMGYPVVTSVDLLTLAGLLILVSAIISLLLAYAFCARPAPRWLRAWRDVALIIVGARLATRENVALQPDQWLIALIWLHLALCGVAIAAWNVRVTLGAGGDRCPGRVPRGPGG